MAISLSLVIPTYNERQNIDPLLAKIRKTLEKIPYEIIFVDDDSPDGTGEHIRALAKDDLRIRVIRRVGRRGLSSACVEGMSAAAGDTIAVMDADLQHDESILPEMYGQIAEHGQDLVIGSRFVDQKPTDGLSQRRNELSSVGIKISNMLLPCKLTDPLSGFFMLRRTVVQESLTALSQVGFKILFDLLLSYPNKLKVKEVPFQFRKRLAGDSKLDSVVLWDFMIYVLERATGRMIPASFISFSIVGGLGVIFHMAILKSLMTAGLEFLTAHISATALAIAFNFFLNNTLTYRDRRLHGKKLVMGLVSFYLICTLGAGANVGIAAYLYRAFHTQWAISAIGGILVGTVWNYTMSSIFSWRKSGR